MMALTITLSKDSDIDVGIWKRGYDLQTAKTYQLMEWIFLNSFDIFAKCIKLLVCWACYSYDLIKAFLLFKKPSIYILNDPAWNLEIKQMARAFIRSFVVHFVWYFDN